MTHLASNTPSTVIPQPNATVLTQTHLADLFQLTKPRITLMVVLTAYIGFALGMKNTGIPLLSAWPTLIATLFGVALSCIGAGILNQVYEQDTDTLMRRTQNRPVPTGRIRANQALLIGGLACIAGVGLLAVKVNLITALLAGFTILSYWLIYTPMKRVTHLSTIIGAVPGALPPAMGFAAATGRLGIEAWLMFGILFLWQLPHFLAIAWLYRDQYAGAGMAMLPVVDPDGHSTFRQILLGCLALVPLGLLPTMLGVAGMIYFFGSLIAGVVFLGFGVALAVSRTRRHARAMFLASLVYLPLIYTLMLIDYVR